MARYLYRCENCAHELEAEHSMTAEALRDCPSCATPMLERVIRSRPAIRVKSGGEGYQAGLARFPGDRRAHCDGPRAVSKLLDWHKRRGMRPISASDVETSDESHDDNGPTFKDFLEA